MHTWYLVVACNILKIVRHDVRPHGSLLEVIVALVFVPGMNYGFALLMFEMCPALVRWLLSSIKALPYSSSTGTTWLGCTWPLCLVGYLVLRTRAPLLGRLTPTAALGQEYNYKWEGGRKKSP